MALIFQRRLAIPLWAIAFSTVALTAPPSATLLLMPLTTVFAMAAVGIGAILFLAPGAMTWLRAYSLPRSRGSSRIPGAAASADGRGTRD
jgi:hypothetical protein